MTNPASESISAADIAVGDTGPEVVVEDLQRRDFVEYAGASGDFTPIHYDEPFATGAGYESVFGQGMLTAGYVSCMATDWFGLDRIDTFSTRFEARVLPGDTITVTGTVTEKTETEDGAEVTAALRAENGDGDAVVTGSVTATLPIE